MNCSRLFSNARTAVLQIGLAVLEVDHGLLQEIFEPIVVLSENFLEMIEQFLDAVSLSLETPHSQLHGRFVIVSLLSFQTLVYRFSSVFDFPPRNHLTQISE